jgi:hypothetical protein
LPISLSICCTWHLRIGRTAVGPRVQGHHQDARSAQIASAAAARSASCHRSTPARQAPSGATGGRDRGRSRDIRPLGEFQHRRDRSPDRPNPSVITRAAAGLPDRRRE